MIGTVLALSGIVALYLLQRRRKEKSLNDLKVLEVDISIMKDYKPDSDINIIRLFDMACDRIQVVIYQGKVDTRTILTLYSLYKQVKEWDADEAPGAEEQTPPEKYRMWLQQKGKDEIRCMKEYIVLIAQFDKYTESVLK